MVGGALCVSFRCTELKRCAASGADERGAGLERNMRMSDRQQKKTPSYFFCAHLCLDACLAVSDLPGPSLRAFQGNVRCELNEPNLFGLFIL